MRIIRCCLLRQSLSPPVSQRMNLEEVVVKTDKNENIVQDCHLKLTDHGTQTSFWTPPENAWRCPYGLPHGWEMAMDTTGKPYYVNHKEQITTYSDPRAEEELDIPEPRDVHILRHATMGYGFVAGSEKPVVIRFVTEGGPSDEKLLPGDEILAINSEDVRDAEKDHVVRLVRNCPNEVMLTVCQPRSGDSSLKSAILSASKRSRLRHNPSRVRFAEGVQVGTPPNTPSGSESCVPLMPNVLRVFLENGQTRSFKYDHTTTVNDVIDSLCEKLGLCKKENFALMLEHPQGPRSNKLAILRKEDKLARVAARPGSQHFRCLLRIAFVPNDPAELQRLDAIAFDYYYQQISQSIRKQASVLPGCCLPQYPPFNEILGFAYEMRYEACLRLAALQMQQVALDTHVTSGGKISLKAMEKEYGLNTFLPLILIENVKRKEIRKHLRYYLKRDFNKHSGTAFTGHNNNNNFGAGLTPESCSTASAASNCATNSTKLKYVHMLSHLPTFGGRSFYVTFKDTNTEMMLQVHPRNGILVRSAGRSSEPTLSMHFDTIAALYVIPQNEIVKQLTIRLIRDPSQLLDFLVDKDDMDDLVLYIQGYYALASGCTLETLCEEDNSDSAVPPYHGLHSVKAAGWNYAKQSGDASFDVRRSVSDGAHKEHLVDLSRGPPRYHNMVKVPQPPKQMAVSTRITYGKSARDSHPTEPLLSDEDAEAQTQSHSVSVEVHAESSNEASGSTEQNPRFTIGPTNMSNSSTVTTESESVTMSESLRLSQMAEEEEEEEDEMDQCIAVIEKQLNSEKLNRKQNEDYVRHSFLKAKDSLLIKNRPPVRRPVVPSEIAQDPSTRASASPAKAGDKEIVVQVADLSSSDTESLTTPSESPIHRAIKTRPAFLKHVTPQTGAKNPSFGLQSPDTLPCSLLSEKEVHQLIANCGLEGEQLEDLLLLFPDNFCTDAEITDLTILPSPKTPENPKVVDIVSVAVAPPTPFRDVDPQQEFHNVQTVMDRLAEGDVAVIEDSHQKASKRCREARKRTSTQSAKEPQWKEVSGSDQQISAYPSITNRAAFEEFLAKSIIPPPPPLSLEESRLLLDQTSQPVPGDSQETEIKSNPSEKRVRFSTTAIVRQRSASGGLERVLAKHRLKERICADKIVSLNKAGKIGRLVESQTYPINTGQSLSDNTFCDERLSTEEKWTEPNSFAEFKTDFVYTGPEPNGQYSMTTSMSDDNVNNSKHKEPRRTTLHDFSGLEGTEFSAPSVTKVDLRDFVGLEGLDQGVASLEVKEEEEEEPKPVHTSPQHQSPRESKPGKVKKFFARIRSVDPYSEYSPDASPNKKRLSESGSSGKKAPLSPPPISEETRKADSVDETNDFGSPNENASDVHVQHVSLAHYSGLESSPKHSIDQGHTESLLCTFSASRRRSLSRGRESDDVSAAAGNCVPPGLGNGFVAPDTSSENLNSPESGRPPTTNEFQNAKSGIEEAIASLVASVEAIPGRSPKRKCTGQAAEKRQELRISLLSESQQLAAASKLLVRSATEPHCQVLPSLQRSVAKAVGVSNAAQDIIRDGGCSLFQAQSLAAKVREVLKALSHTVDSVQEASGKNLCDPEMKKLMLQSTSLAATLTQLIQCVREHMS